MKKAELEQFKHLLLELRARCTGDMSQLADEALRGKDASGQQSNMPIHMADVGSENFEQEFTLSLMEKEEEVVAEIDRALGRIAAGTYGLCEECGTEVLRERLKYIPYTRHCVDCARKLEKSS